MRGAEQKINISSCLIMGAEHKRNEVISTLSSSFVHKINTFGVNVHGKVEGKEDSYVV